jgi:protein phosphatase
MKTFSKTDVGVVREVNQDYVSVAPGPIGNMPNLLVVADGMGGHQAGDYASRQAVETVMHEVRTSGETEPEAMLRQAITVANAKLFDDAAKDENLKGMGTTLIVATVIDKTLYFANVGDSRLYLVNEEIKQLSKDHSLVQEMVRLGGINPEEAKHHPDKNIITRAVGAREKVEIDFYEYRLKKGDIIMMCTDGLTNMVEDEEILHTMKSSRDLVEMVERLIERAKENGGSDNIGVVVAEPFADEANV